VWSRNKALAESCSKKMGEDWDGIGRYMNTPQVATDMVAIIEALGEWREKQGQALISKSKCHKAQAHDIAERTKWSKGQEKLLYIGFSYGTVLGATFSTLYPDKVHRVVLDGVCDLQDYYSGTWLSNLVDTDMIIGSFFKQCYEAGPVRCPLWSAEGIDGIRKRYHGLLDKLKNDPLPVDAHDKYSADVITVSDAMNVVRQAVYQPYEWFPKLATFFDLLTKGDGTALAASKQDGRISNCRSPTCASNPYSKACYSDTHTGFKEELSAGILCTDGPADQLKWDSADHFAKWHVLREQSRALGDFWAEITMYCANWNVRPSWNFSYADAAGTAPIKTSHPLLFASTTRDPVTPLRNARAMQGRFEGAGLVTLEDDGHCSIGAPSLCQARVLGRYFQSGEVPEQGKECLPDRWPFDDAVEVDEAGVGVRELVEAMEHVSRGRRSSSQAFPLGI
jgi:pimeloyl-ACP methyl ester carboxylesterase